MELPGSVVFARRSRFCRPDVRHLQVTEKSDFSQESLTWYLSSNINRIRDDQLIPLGSLTSMKKKNRKHCQTALFHIRHLFGTRIDIANMGISLQFAFFRYYE